MVVNNEFLSGLSDFFKEGKKYGYKAFPPSWMNKEEKDEYFRGKRYAIEQSVKC